MKNLNHIVSMIQQNYTTIKVSFDNMQRLPVKEAQTFEASATGLPEIFEQKTANRQQSPGQLRTYTYKCPHTVANRLEPGMLVIVPESNHKGVQIATVQKIDAEPDINYDSDIQYKWIIGAVDTTDYDRIIRQENQMVQLLRESEKAKARQALLDAYKLSLPEGSEARKLFDEAAQLGEPQAE